MDSKASRLGASLAYYTIFAIAPLFLIAISMAAFFFGQAAATRDLYHQINSLVGHDGGDVIQSLVAAAAHRPRAGLWATFGALITLGTGATAVFVELQDALNTIWCVESKGGGGVWCFIKNRLLSFAMVLGIGFLLLVSLLLNAALTALGSFASGILPEKRLVLDALNFVLSLGVITLLFALIYKLLPDVNIAWGDVWVGAFVTALLFNLGKFLSVIILAAAAWSRFMVRQAPSSSFSCGSIIPLKSFFLGRNSHGFTRKDGLDQNYPARHEFSFQFQW